MLLISLDRQVSTHSRPKAAARDKLCTLDITQSFNTQPLEGGCSVATTAQNKNGKFQHTAARRRLLSHIDWMRARYKVSTHSRSKAAASKGRGYGNSLTSFNTQPLEGGCLDLCELPERYTVSTHSRSKAAANKNVSQLLLLKFQHTAARRRLLNIIRI